MNNLGEAIKKQGEAVRLAFEAWSQCADPELEEACFLEYQAELMKQSALAVRIKALEKKEGVIA